MRYGDSITKDIISELERVPIIRQACVKVGIDHSTFYRWMVKHPSFLKEVMAALYLSRKKINDMAESVIISGIQNKDFKASSFWLTHNEPRFMSFDKGRYHSALNDRLVKILGDELPEDYPVTFEKTFETFYSIETLCKPEKAIKMMDPVRDILCYDDPNLVDIFNAAYIEWKNDKIALDAKIKESGMGEGEDVD